MHTLSSTILVHVLCAQACVLYLAFSKETHFPHDNDDAGCCECTNAADAGGTESCQDEASRPMIMTLLCRFLLTSLV